jgi:hypothetical protein
VLVVNAAERVSQHVHSPATDRRRALELLAAVEPTARAPVTALLAEEASPAARALEVVVVTARIDGALTDRLVQRALSHRRVSLVYVDAPTFAGASPRAEPLLLRLTSCGVPVAVARAGDDLKAVLSGETVAAEAALA